VLDNLVRLTEKARGQKGGSLLNVIYRMMIEAQEPSVKGLFESLLNKAFVPYLKTLKKWIFQGLLDDPFDEFIVKQDSTQKKENIANDFSDQYWT